VGSFGLSSVSASSASGIDVVAFVEQVLYAERAPVRLLQTQQTQFNSQASALRDLTTKLLDLQTKVNALNDVSGSFNAKSATSSDPTVLTATATATAIAATHTVVVSALATTSSYYTDQLADGSTQFATGTFNIQVATGAPLTITVDDTNNTLDELATHINGLDMGVEASVITDANGARLALVSETSGAPGDLTVSGNTTGLAFTKAVAGTNASLTVDGVPIASASNTVTGVISGVTLSLVSAQVGTPVTVKIDPDTAEARAAIDDFVASYNALITALNEQFTYNPTTKKAGALSTDSSVRRLQQQLLEDINYSITDNNGFVNLATIGVHLANDGTLTVDSTELDNALGSHFGEVQNLLQSLAPAGFARNFSTDLQALAASVDGPLNLSLSGVNRTLDSLADQIRDFEVRLELRREVLTEQFSRIDALLRQLPALLSQISTQLGSLR